jgi:hypothetical protein
MDNAWKNRYPEDRVVLINPGPGDTIRVPVILAQIFLFGGILFSVAAIGSCRFVYATISKIVGDLPVPLPGTPESYLPTDSRRGLGFLFFEMENGKCSNSLGEDLAGTLLDVDFLNGDWRGPRLFGVMSMNLLLFMMGFTFIAYLRPVRYAVYALCLAILVVFQSVTFAVITSDFCGDADCELGRGAGFCIAAFLCFFFSSFAFLIGHPRDEDAEAATGTGKGAYVEASLADTGELTAEDGQPTEQAVSEQVLIHGLSHRFPRDQSSLRLVCCS